MTDVSRGANLREKTIAGVGWSTGARLIEQGIRFGVSIVLMRLLLPEDYGLVGMAMVFIGFAALFKEFGLSSALVQREEITDLQTSSVFWLNVTVGCGLAVLFYALAPLVASFYGESELESITQVLAVTYVVGAVSTVPQALLQREMAFDRLAKIQIPSVIVAGLLAIGMAFSGWGVWSLVAESLLLTGVGSLLVWWYVSWRPELVFSLTAIRDLISYGAGLTGFKFVNYWARKGDDLLIGRFIGSAELGIYTRAYSLMLLPITQIISMVSRVMFSALSTIQDDEERVRRAYLRVMRLLSFIIFPMMLGLYVVAESFVVTLFGQKWIEVTAIIQILCFVGLIQSLLNPTGWIYTSQGRTDWMFWWGVGAGGTMIAAIVVGVWIGTIEAVAWAYLVANVVLLLPGIKIPGMLISLRVRDVLEAVAGNFLCAAIMMGAVWAVGALLPADLFNPLRLATQVLTGVVVYTLIAYAFNLTALHEAKSLLSEVWHKRGSVAEVQQ